MNPIPDDVLARNAPADAPPAPAALVPAEDRTQPSPAGATDPILAMIERAARDPSVDIEKFERLMAMKDKVAAERASLAFAASFADLQPDLPTIDRSGTIVVYSKTDREKPGGVPEGARPIQQTPYATLDDIIEALRKPLGQHGFSLRFEYTTQPAGESYRIITTAIVRHRDGHEEKASSPPLQHDSSGSKNNVQAVGSSMTYGRRYALMAVLPIVSHASQDADDDGRAAGKASIDIDEVAYVEQLLRDTDSDVPIFLDTIGAASVADFNAAQYKRAVSLLNEKKRRAAADAKKKAAQP